MGASEASEGRLIICCEYCCRFAIAFRPSLLDLAHLNKGKGGGGEEGWGVEVDVEGICC